MGKIEFDNDIMYYVNDNENKEIDTLLELTY
jgi:hypothetical protein